MTSSWHKYKLEDLKANKKNAFAMGPFGSNIKAENFVREGTPIIKGGNLNGTYLIEDFKDFLNEEKTLKLSSSVALKGDIVITHRGTLGQVGLIHDKSKYEKYIVSQSQLKLSFDLKRVDPYYIYYFLISNVGQYRLLANTSQVGVPAIAQALTSIKSIEIDLPDLLEQRKISNILKLLDSKKNNLIQLNQTLESIAQAIFKSWFIDFDPVHAKQQGVLCAGIDKATADLFPDSFEESEQGLIPTGWTTKQLKDIAVRHVEKIKNVVDWENEYLIDLSRIDSKTLFNINNGFGKELTTSVTKFAKGDILFGAIRPYFHKVTIANLNGVTNISVFVIRPSVDFYHEYLANLMFNESTVNFSVRLSKGTKMPVISWSDLSTLKITLAPESIIKKYSELISPLMKKGIENSALINSLTSIRDTLLPRLISGKLNLSNIEEELEGIA
jgi:type I restriction enzyme S subunit